MSEAPLEKAPEATQMIYDVEGRPEDIGRIKDPKIAEQIAYLEKPAREYEMAAERETRLGLTPEQERCREVFDQTLDRIREKVRKTIPDFNVNSIVKLDENGKEYMDVVFLYSGLNGTTMSCILLTEGSEPQLFQLFLDDPKLQKEAEATLENIKPGFSFDDKSAEAKQASLKSTTDGGLRMMAENKVVGAFIPGVESMYFKSFAFRYAELNWDNPDNIKGIGDGLSRWIGDIIKREKDKPELKTAPEIAAALLP